jgi:hypothetical protein
MKTMISKFLNALRFSKYDFVNHSVWATVLYILLRVVFVAAAVLVAVKPEYQAIAACFSAFLITGSLEIYQYETKTGAAQGRDYLAGLIPVILCMVWEFAIASSIGWYTVPGFDATGGPIIVSVIGAGLYYWLVIRDKFI